jgi:hypothetical protein
MIPNGQWMTSPRPRTTSETSRSRDDAGFVSGTRRPPPSTPARPALEAKEADGGECPPCWEQDDSRLVRCTITYLDHTAGRESGRMTGVDPCWNLSSTDGAFPTLLDFGQFTPQERVT